MKRPTLVLLSLLMATALPAAARDVGGIQVPDSVTVPEAKKPLALNGAAFRTRFLIKIYVGALYTALPYTRAEQVLGAPTPRVMRLQFVRAVDSETLAKGWKDSLAANHSNFEMQAFRARLQQFNSYMPNAKENDVLRIDLLPRGITRVLVNDKVRGSIEGSDFQQAVLKAWIGSKPADSDLKQAVLAGGK